MAFSGFNLQAQGYYASEGPSDAMLIFNVISIIIGIFIMRWLGAWMFRIKDLIHVNKEIVKQLIDANNLKREEMGKDIIEVPKDLGAPKW